MHGLLAVGRLALLATAAGHDPAQIPGLLELVGLGARSDDRFRGYSFGMKQRLGIAAALLGDPRLLILDEPVNGLDPAGVHEIRGLIGRLAGGGRTVLVSSHVLAELEQVCDWLIVIDGGQLVFQGPAADLLDSSGATSWSPPSTATTSTAYAACSRPPVTTAAQAMTTSRSL